LNAECVTTIWMRETMNNFTQKVSSANVAERISLDEKNKIINLCRE